MSCTNQTAGTGQDDPSPSPVYTYQNPGYGTGEVIMGTNIIPAHASVAVTTANGSSDAWILNQSYEYGVIGNLIDGNITTGYGSVIPASGGMLDTGNVGLQYVYTLDTERYIDKLKIFLKYTGDNVNGGSYVYIFYNNTAGKTGVVALEYGNYWGTQYDLSSGGTFDIHDNIKSITIQMGGRAHKDGGGLTWNNIVYEVQAFPTYAPTGVSARSTSGSIQLVQGPSSSPLRSAGPSGTVVPVLLVPLTDLAASPIRVSTSSGIKAAAKYI
jgi:hypothetical protein